MSVLETQARFERVLPLLCCPLCHAALTAGNGSLVCENGHSYDLSAKGYVNLAPWQRQQDFAYGKALFENRRAVLRAGFYQPVLDAATQLMNGAESILDAGCGEGWYAWQLAKRFLGARVLGADLSRDGIALAASQKEAAFFVADVTRLPVTPNSLDAVLDVLTPADYAQFAKALKKGGRLIKALPQSDYLIEIRDIVKNRLQSEAYSNERVITHLQKHAAVLETRRVCETFAVPMEMGARFLRMTPMTMGLSEDELQALTPPTQITIDMLVLACEPTAP